MLQEEFVNLSQGMQVTFSIDPFNNLNFFLDYAIPLLPFKQHATYKPYRRFSGHPAGLAGHSKSASHSCVKSNQPRPEQCLVMTYDHSKNRFDLSPSFSTIKVVLPDQETPKLNTPQNGQFLPTTKSPKVTSPNPKTKRSQSSGKKVFSCTLCKKCFSHNLQLQRHRENWHNEAQDLSCPLCNKMLKRKIFLIKHFETCRGDFC